MDERVRESVSTSRDLGVSYTFKTDDGSLSENAI